MRYLTLLLLLGCTSCGIRASGPAPAPAPTPPGSAPSAPTPAPAPGTAASGLPAIRAMIGSASCTDNTQCRTVALGARACGGPESYLAWSSAATQAAPLLALAERYNTARRAEVAASGAMSTCQFMPDPGAQCRAGTCQLNTGPAAAM